MDPLHRLRQHAGISYDDDTISTDTIGAFLFNVTRKDVSLQDLHSATNDIIRCLNEINKVINLRDNAISHSKMIDSLLAYCVSLIVVDCISEHIIVKKKQLNSTVADEILMAAWRIQTAWDSLLAGDIDDLASDVALTEFVKFS